jgi:hypothetical protein
MRVFTQKVQLTPLELHQWIKPVPGQFREYEAWVHEFNQVHPNVVPMENHDLDYRVLYNTPDNDPFYIVGYYWGDETTLPGATYWVSNNKVLNVQQRRWVITCNDDEHPAIGPAANMQIDDFLTSVQAVRQGYWLWGDKESFVSYYS